MILQSLRLKDVRIHRHSTLNCPPGLVILYGENGAGKTSVLEAISCLCSSRSFVTSQEKSLLGNDADFFEVSGTFCSDGGSTHTVGFRYPIAGRKQIELDFAPLQQSADLIGRFPIVILSPQHRMVTSGAPSERRSFMDFAIAQIHHRYLVDLLEYRRILRQRNALLARNDVSQSYLFEQLDAWDRTCASHAARIIRERLLFLDAFRPYVVEMMNLISAEREAIRLEYRSTVEGIEHGALEQECHAALLNRRSTDIKMKTTTVGPHRDDLVMSFNDLDVRSHASQGQHKSLLVALKIAEFHYMSDRLEERPILLLDDVFGELDDERLARIVPLVRSLGQTFITTAHSSVLRQCAVDTESEVFMIERGTIASLKEAA